MKEMEYAKIPLESNIKLMYSEKLYLVKTWVENR